MAGVVDGQTNSKHLVLRFKLSNSGDEKMKYDPWYLGANSFAKDEAGRRYNPWLAGVGVRPVDSVRDKMNIMPSASVMDTVVIDEPNWLAEEIDIFLPGENVGLAKRAFVFKLTREFFETPASRKASIDLVILRARQKEADRLTKADADRYAAEFNKLKLPIIEKKE